MSRKLVEILDRELSGLATPNSLAEMLALMVQANCWVWFRVPLPPDYVRGATRTVVDIANVTELQANELIARAGDGNFNS